MPHDDQLPVPHDPPRRGGVWSSPPTTSSPHPPPPHYTVDIIIPALNEEHSIGLVLSALDDPHIRHIIVADNGSTDRTAEIARQHGAHVVREPRRGYGAACLAGLEHLKNDPPTVVAFLDGDLADHPQELSRLLAPIALDGAELVIGSRTIGMREPGALLPQALFGNHLASALISLLYSYRFTDLGPFRAIRWSALSRLQMEDTNYGWTVEMQVKAAFHNLDTVEVPVSYRQRIGISKVSGTLEGSVRAGYKILATIFLYYLKTLRAS